MMSAKSTASSDPTEGKRGAHAARQSYFSLVMPVYGVERYIMDSIADLLCQTFGEFELIVVDDASPDRSIEIASDLAGGDERVRIIHHETNLGVSEARNTGIAAARGKWLMFPDPDDRYDERMLEYLHDRLEDSAPDLLIFAHTQEYFGPDGAFLYSNALPLPDSLYVGLQNIGRTALLLERDTHLGYPWNKVYRTDIVKAQELRFETVPFIEDIAFNLRYLEHTNMMMTCSFSPYRYAKRVQSNLTNAHDARYYEAHRRRIAEVRSMLASRACLDDSSKRILGALYARYILSTLERNCASDSKMNIAARWAWIEQLYRDPLFIELIPAAEADQSKELALCLSFLKARNTPALLAIGRGIHIVRTASTSAYTKVRSKR